MSFFVSITFNLPKATWPTALQRPEALAESTH